MLCVSFAHAWTPSTLGFRDKHDSIGLVVASFRRNTAPIPKRCTVSVSSSPSSRLWAALGFDALELPEDSAIPPGPVRSWPSRTHCALIVAGFCFLWSVLTHHYAFLAFPNRCIALLPPRSFMCSECSQASNFRLIRIPDRHPVHGHRSRTTCGDRESPVGG